MDGNIIFLVLLAIIYLFQYLAGRGKPKPGQKGQPDPADASARREDRLEGRSAEDESPEIRSAIDEIGRLLRGEAESPPAREVPRRESSRREVPAGEVPHWESSRREVPAREVPHWESSPREKTHQKRRSGGPSLPEPHWEQAPPPSRTADTPARDTGAPPRRDKPLVSAPGTRSSIPTRPLRVRKPKEIEAVQTREVKRLLSDQQSARDAVVAAELLGPPVSKRRRGR